MNKKITGKTDSHKYEENQPVFSNSVKSITINESTLWLLFENSSVGHSISRLDGTTFSNKVFHDTIGYTAEEFGKMNMLEITHPDDRGMTKDYMQSLLDEKNSKVRYIKRFIHKNGDIVWVDISTFLQRDTLNNPQFFLTTIIDISTQKRIEETLQNKGEELKTIMDSVPAWIFYKDANNKFIRVNKTYSDFIGIDKKQLEGKSLFEMFSKEQADNYWNDDIAVIKSGIPKKNIIESMESPEGLLWVQTDKIPYFDANGNIIGIIGFTIDITERIRSEELLQLNKQELERFFNLIPDMVCTFSPGGYLINVNEAWTNILGFSKEELLSIPYSEFIHPDDLEITLKEIEIHLDNLEPIHITNRFRCVDGSYRHFEWDAIPAIDGFIYAAARDITERKQAEEELLRLNNQLNELNNTKDKLFSIIAHDLKSPLGSILGFSELLIKNFHRYESEKSLIFIDQILNSSKQTITLIDNLMAWARTQTGKFNFTPENICLYLSVYEVLGIIGPSAKLKSITLKSSIPEDIKVYADEGMLQTILRNLISNAVKFTKVDGTVNVFAMSEQNVVEIIIEDNGVGMNDEVIPKLFNINSNITTRGTASEKGTGLGLILCKSFVEKHGGKIWVESEPNIGTKFHFTLPKK